MYYIFTIHTTPKDSKIFESYSERVSTLFFHTINFSCLNNNRCNNSDVFAMVNVNFVNNFVKNSKIIKTKLINKHEK